MPTVKDKLTGKIISEQPYTPEGKILAEEISEKEPSWEISDAMQRSESYQLGGIVPGQEGFGERPALVAPPMGGMGPGQGDASLGGGVNMGKVADMVLNPASSRYKKGGKVKK